MMKASGSCEVHGCHVSAIGTAHGCLRRDRSVAGSEGPVPAEGEAGETTAPPAGPGAAIVRVSGPTSSAVHASKAHQRQSAGSRCEDEVAVDAAGIESGVRPIVV